MKKQISVCIFLSIVLITLILAFVKFNNGKEQEHTQLTEDSTDSLEISQEYKQYMFYILEEDTHLVVYETKSDSIYMETGISAKDLPLELQKDLKTGFFFETEQDLYDFLESYSS